MHTQPSSLPELTHRRDCVLQNISLEAGDRDQTTLQTHSPWMSSRKAVSVCTTTRAVRGKLRGLPKAQLHLSACSPPTHRSCPSATLTLDIIQEGSVCVQHHWGREREAERLAQGPMALAPLLSPHSPLLPFRHTHPGCHPGRRCLCAPPLSPTCTCPSPVPPSVAHPLTHTHPGCHLGRRCLCAPPLGPSEGT